MQTENTVTGREASFNGKMISMGPLVRTDSQIRREERNLSVVDTIPRADSDASECSDHIQTQSL
jgi:hypothetical protein